VVQKSHQFCVQWYGIFIASLDSMYLGTQSLALSVQLNYQYTYLSSFYLPITLLPIPPTYHLSTYSIYLPTTLLPIIHLPTTSIYFQPFIVSFFHANLLIHIYASSRSSFISDIYRAVLLKVPKEVFGPAEEVSLKKQPFLDNARQNLLYLAS